MAITSSLPQVGPPPRNGRARHEAALVLLGRLDKAEEVLRDSLR
jgi:hypothetical protein